jgi:hypothetical protein
MIVRLVVMVFCILDGSPACDQAHLGELKRQF